MKTLPRQAALNYHQFYSATQNCRVKIVPIRFDLLPSHLTLPELFRLFRRRSHRVHYCRAQFAFFQLVQAFDGCSAGAGHLVLKSARMLAGFQDHLCRAQYRLCRQPGGDVPRQTGRHAPVTKRLDELINIRRSAAA